MLPWLSHLTSWLRGGQAGAAAAGAAAPAALSLSEQAAVEAAAAAKPDAEHLIVMVHGLFGTRDNWRAIRTLLDEHLDRRATALFVSHCNERQKTFDGIDTCGERLAEEIQAVAAQHPRLRRISILAHSMGGLISRYAVGRLYDPATRTVAGLAPCHFVCIATPHLGCDTRLSPAQVPLINWLSAVPAVGGAVHTVVSGLAAPVSSIALGRAGLQFFFMDTGSRPMMIGSSTGSSSSPSSNIVGSSGGAGSNLVSSGPVHSSSGGSNGRQEPLLYRLSQDQPDEGLLFMSALSAFETRTLYANSSGDHLVGWANSSLRRLHELPPKNGRGTGVIREDPLEFAWRPEQRPALHATPAAVELHSGESHRVSSAAILQAHTAEELVAGSSSGGGGGPNGGGSAANGSIIAGSSSSSSSSGGMDQETLGLPRGNAAVASSSNAAEQVRLAASAAAAQPAGGADPSGSSRNGGGSTAVAGSIVPPLPAGQQSRAHEQRLEEMLARLQALGWRRVDVCFAGAALPFLAHQHIQQQRVINWPGQATVKHLALQLAAMEQLRAAGQQGATPAVRGTVEGH
ncbi:alpha beta-hydrolases superfamily [Chlorella sorokiniana]|uniref:Alpha beta-hydrolases superfamily n=1 Tax=Chlorella sorokiniana TaxID=3076 RepID=A0A2P6TMS2_CHLSO|nr:alpha beta-hydrolases superfamily [Chlorella sorokiniana]|eukprot:PRW45615.1 alpha beta-hydrolases superfamily [Chlorella sorokiniana]